MSFIPADESRFYIWFFDLYTRWSLKRRFKQIWIKQAYQPKPSARTVYFLNHNSWWDGLIPLYLNENFFHQQARALMEDKQMRQFGFFSKIGAFSINLEDPRSSLQSLRYALKSMQRERSSLFIYPEGKLSPISADKPEFKKGLAWLYSRTEGVDYVPINIYMHSFRDSRHELYLNIGKPVVTDSGINREKLNLQFESSLQGLSEETRSVAGFSDKGFNPQF